MVGRQRMLCLLDGRCRAAILYDSGHRDAMCRRHAAAAAMPRN